MVNVACTEDYIEEIDWRIKERIHDHTKRNKNSHTLKHSCEEGHRQVWDIDFQVLGNNSRSNFKQKITVVKIYSQNN